MDLTAAGQPRFFQALDTFRSQTRQPSDVAAQLQLSLLTGQRVLLSQTQAFDGTHFLSFAESPFFLDLLREGHLQVHLLPDGDNAPSLCRTLAAKAAGQSFQLCAWTELAASDAPPDPARILLEAADTPQPRSSATIERLRDSFGDAFAKRWETLYRVDRALRELPEASRLRVHPAENIPLDQRLRQEAEAAYFQPELQAVLRRVADVGGILRTGYVRAIESTLGFTPAQKLSALSVVDAAYNRVVAVSLNARADLESPSLAVSEVLSRTAPDEPGERRSLRPAPELAGSLKGLSWRTLRDIVTLLNDPKRDAEYKADHLAELAVVGAQEAVDQQGKRSLRLALAPELVNEAIDATAGEAFKEGAKHLVHLAVEAAPVVFGFTHLLPALSLPVLLAAGKVLFGRNLNPATLVEERLKERMQRQREAEIITLIRSHPQGAELPLP